MNNKFYISSFYPHEIQSFLHASNTGGWLYIKYMATVLKYQQYYDILWEKTNQNKHCMTLSYWCITRYVEVRTWKKQYIHNYTHVLYLSLSLFLCLCLSLSLPPLSLSDSISLFTLCDAFSHSLSPLFLSLSLSPLHFSPSLFLTISFSLSWIVYPLSFLYLRRSLF